MGVADMQPREHDLKTWPEFWHAVREGRKTFELRKDDRGYMVGDQLRLLLWDPSDFGSYLNYRGERCHSTGSAATLVVEVVYKMLGGLLGVREGYCVLGIRLLEDA